MNLPYIQTELFRELVGMETLLKPEFRLQIIRHFAGGFAARLWQKKPLPEPPAYRDHYWHLKKGWLIDDASITTPAQITAETNRIWQAIPAECKREDILK